MGKTKLVFTMTKAAAVKVDESPDGPRVVVRLKVQGPWPPPSRRCIRVMALLLLCKLGGLRLAGVRGVAWALLPNERSSCPNSVSCPPLTFYRQALHEPCQPAHSASSPTICLPTIPLYRDSSTYRPQRSGSCSRRLPCLSAGTARSQCSVRYGGPPGFAVRAV